MAQDSSIPLQGQVSQNGGFGNALGIYMQLLQARNLQNQQALFQQQFEARQAIGPILQQSIDPKSGEVDYNKAFQLAAGNPQTAFLAGDLLNQGIQRQQTQANITKTNLENAKTQLDNVAGVATGLLSQATQTNGADGNPTYSLDPNKVGMALNQAVKDGRVPSEMMQRIAGQLSDDPTALYQSIKQFALTSDAHSKQLDSILGKIESTNVGGGTVYNLMAPGAQNQVTRLAAQPSTATPGELLRTEQVINPLTKETQVVPVGRLFGGSQGAIPPLQGGASVSSSNNPLIQTSTPQTPQTSQGSAAPNPLPVSAPSGAVTAAPPGSAKAEELLKSEYAPQLSNLAANVNQQKLILSEIKNQMDDLPKEGQIDKVTGPGAKVKNLVGNFLAAAGASPETVNNWQNISDYATLRSKMMDVVIPQARLMFGNAGGHGIPVGEYTPFASVHLDPSMPKEAIGNLLNYYGKIGGLTQLQSKMLGTYLDAAQDPVQRAAIHGNKYLSQNDFINGFSDYLHSQAGRARLQQYGVVEGNQ